MTTRSELRAHQREEEDPSIDPTPVKHQHHLMFRLWGTLLLTLLLLAVLLNSTLLSKNFVKHEITTSSLETVMLDQVNSSLTQYGISTSVLQKSETDKLVNQAVDQVYAGEKINLDLSPVVNNVGSAVNSELAQYGISSSMLPAQSTATVTANVNSAVNKQLNTPAVAQLTTGIKVARVVVNIVLLVSLVLLVVMIVKSIWQHHLISSFSWVSFLSLLLFAVVVNSIRVVATQMGAQFSDASPFISQFADDFQQRGMTYVYLLAVVAIILFGWRIVKRIWQPHR